MELFDLAQRLLAATLPTLLAGLAVLWYRHKYAWNRRSQGLPLPPGPKPWPILGNFFDIPNAKRPWVAFRDLGAIYGDMMFFQVGQSSSLIVSSTKIAYDLMEKRSRIYSDKPVSVMDELTGWDFNVGLMPYGDRWRSIRRNVHQYFNQFATKRYRARQTSEIRKFLRQTIDAKGALSFSIIRYTMARIIFSVVFSQNLSGMEDEHIRTATAALHYLGESKVLGAFWIEFAPVLKHIPAWFPGAAARKLAARARPIVEKMVNKPFDGVKYGKHRDECIALDLLRKLDSTEDAGQRALLEKHARDSAGIIYTAAIDTTTSLLSFFFSAMAVHPEVQAKAHRELDAVVGRDRLPEFEDYDTLPYIRAILLETFRWMPVLPLGAPRAALEDDYYEGYFIPKGTIIIPNVWAMMHNPEHYPQPEEFNPDRWLKNGDIDRDHLDPIFTFGFGRRICPGRYFAQDNAFLTMASALHVFNVEAAVDEYGNKLDPRPVPTTTGLVVYPERLSCVLKPRFETAEQLVEAFTISTDDLV